MLHNQNTIGEFLSECNLSDKLRKKIIDNLASQKEVEIVLNLTQLEFDFTTNQAKLSYYIVDNKYPDVLMSFSGLRELLVGKSFRNMY